MKKVELPLVVYPGSPVLSSTPATSTPPILLVALESEEASERQVSTTEGKELARELHCEYVELLASDKEKVLNAFYDIVRMLRAAHHHVSGRKERR